MLNDKRSINDVIEPYKMPNPRLLIELLFFENFTIINPIIIKIEISRIITEKLSSNLRE